MKKVKNPDDLDDVAVQSDTRLMDLVKQLDQWETFSASLPSNEKPLFLISILATVTGAGILAWPLLQGVGVNISYIIWAVFGFYALTAVQTMLETYMRWRSSEREMKQIYDMRRLVVEAFVESSPSFSKDDMALATKAIAMMEGNNPVTKAAE